MHGLGNDFMVVDARALAADPDAATVRALADRRRGVGFDQLLLLDAAPPGDEARPAADFAVRIRNADGSVAEQCGNGMRCVALYVRRRGLGGRAELAFDTPAGRVHARFLAGGEVTCEMGLPRLAPETVPFVAPPGPPRAPAPPATHELELEGRTVRLGVLSMGNPHAVLEVEEVTAAPVAGLGSAIGAHARFPEGANVGFMQIVNRRLVRLRVHERGAGETLACGSGACAAVVAGRLWGRLAEAVEVELPGGRLRVAWDGEGEPVWMTGPASWVYEGVIDS